MIKAKGAHLAWFVVSDLNKSKKFFTEELGFKLSNESEEFGWMELNGVDGGMTIGIARKDDMTPILPGQNAVITITVDDVVKAKESLTKKGVKMHGEIQEIPGHVKMQLFSDNDGNYFQLCQLLE